MQADVVIRNGQIVTDEAVFEADLAVLDGKIAAIGNGFQGKQVWQAEGCFVLPGGVDVHVHPQMPFGEEQTSDTWHAASRAAACGGVTTLIDFVEPRAGQSLMEAFRERLNLIRPQALVDFGLHMTLCSSDRTVLNEIPRMADQGITSFKLYTVYPGFALSDDDLLAALEAIQRAGGLAMVHAENDAILRRSLNKLVEAGKTAPQDYPRSRPPEAEAEAVQRVIYLARQTDAPVYFVHLTTEAALQAVERACSQGWPVFAETCPQYLIFDESRYARPDPLDVLGYICAPPLRSRADQTALWDFLIKSVIQSIGSDHCAFSLYRQKARGMEDFRLAAPGLPGIEARLSLIYFYGVCGGKISLNRWVSLCCAQPARLFGLYPQKGSLQVGSDADIVIFDPNLKLRLTHQAGRDGYRLHEETDYTPYEGLELTGWPSTVFLRGMPIVVRHRPVEPAVSGQFIPRQPFNNLIQKGGFANQTTA